MAATVRRGSPRGATTTAVAAALVACILFTADALAQSNGLRADARFTVLPPASVISANPVRVYVGDTPDAFVPDELPSNLTLSKSLKPIAEMMLRRSAIFRRQCLRIANAPHLTITIGGFHALPSERARARTRILRRDGGLSAEVQIAPLNDQVELIAHELEHVIEQLDGIDLKMHASLRGAAASVCEDGSFETLRAVRTGLAVSREVDGVR